MGGVPSLGAALDPAWSARRDAARLGVPPPPPYWEPVAQALTGTRTPGAPPAAGPTLAPGAAPSRRPSLTGMRTPSLLRAPGLEVPSLSAAPTPSSLPAAEARDCDLSMPLRSSLRVWPHESGLTQARTPRPGTYGWPEGADCSDSAPHAVAAAAGKTAFSTPTHGKPPRKSWGTMSTAAPGSGPDGLVYDGCSDDSDPDFDPDGQDSGGCTIMI